MLKSKILKNHSRLRSIQVVVQAFYSRRSNSKHDSSFKIVGNADRIDELTNTKVGVNPNWELLAPQDFRFYLPGNVGPAWHDASSTASASIELVDSSAALECTTHECPLLLRPGVIELFPGSDISSKQITVVTLSQKSKTKLTSSNEWENERLTKQFVLAAQDICIKLKLAGYWADFINPFSGLPYNNPYYAQKLYETDARFRCLGFRIIDKGECKMITERGSRNFVGSLFTTAPSSTTILKDILLDYED